jgi:hypothetical protein
MKAKYNQHHYPHPAGHIYLHKKGACTIGLTGAVAMTQEELNFYGEIMAEALANMTPEQRRRAAKFKSL